MNKKKRKKYFNTRPTNKQRTDKQLKLIQNFQSVIQNNHHKIWTPELHLNFNSLNTSSWYNLYEHTSNNNHDNFKLDFTIENKNNKSVNNEDNDNSKKNYKTFPVVLRLDKYQKSIIRSLMNAYKIIYFETTNYINRFYIANNIILDSYFTVRSVLIPLIDFIANKTTKYNKIYKERKKFILKKFSIQRSKQCKQDLKQLQKYFKSAYIFRNYVDLDEYKYKKNIIISEYNSLHKIIEELQNQCLTKINDKNNEFIEKKKDIFSDYKIKLNELSKEYQSINNYEDKSIIDKKINICNKKKEQLKKELEVLKKQTDKLQIIINKDIIKINDVYKKQIESTKKTYYNKMIQDICNLDKEYDILDYENYVEYLASYKKDPVYIDLKKNILLHHNCLKSDDCKTELKNLMNQCMKHKNANVKHENHRCILWKNTNTSSRVLREAVSLACSNVFVQI